MGYSNMHPCAGDAPALAPRRVTLATALRRVTLVTALRRVTRGHLDSRDDGGPIVATIVLRLAALPVGPLRNSAGY